MDYNSTKNQNIKGRFVEREVIYCASYLVSGLLSDLPDSEELYDLCQRPDYEETAFNEDKIHVQYSEPMGGYCWVNRETHEISNPYDTELEAYEECCYSHNLEPIYIEAYEHWIVSDYLKDKLEKKGEIVGELYNLPIWGRCTFGQAILLDYVISSICEDMGILEGQSNEWQV